MESKQAVDAKEGEVRGSGEEGRQCGSDKEAVIKLVKTGMPKAGIKGNSGGKKGRSGRKSKAEEMGLVALLDKCWTQAAREKCIKTLATQANRGEIEAVKLLMSYTFGKPTERHEHSGTPEGAPLEIIVRHVKRTGTTNNG